MKKVFFLVLALVLFFLAGCKYECLETPQGCCKGDVCSQMQILCAKGFISKSLGCDENCVQKLTCVKKEECAKEGEMFSSVFEEYPDHCCEGLTEWYSGMDTRKVVGGECVETGLLAGSPIGTCINCGNKICESIENICNCPEDCLECRDEDYWCTFGIPCCDGLKEVPLAFEEEGRCIAATCGSICRPCGNGICDENENRCSCPEDCS